VKLCVCNSIPIVPVPGVSALTAALSVSGLPTDRFLFLGFLPSRSTGRRQALEEVRWERKTIVIFESPKRINQALKDIIEILGDRRAALCREITKAFEDVRRGTIRELIEGMNLGQAKGEITLVIEGYLGKAAFSTEDFQRYRERIIFLKKRCGLSDRDILKVISEEEGISRKMLYPILVEEKEGKSPKR